jgi:beta-phosphoglucomutase-like phosphatase (HAD superfamily)
LRKRGIRVGLASSSRNAVPVLERVGIRDLFDAIVDGVVSDRFHLRGKPESDIFLQCLSQLTTPANPSKAGIAEDAVSGVIAGHRGNFALVLGVDRHHTGALGSNGANWVINDFSEITADHVFAFFAARAPAA